MSYDALTQPKNVLSYCHIMIKPTGAISNLDAEYEVKPLLDDQSFIGLWQGLCEVPRRVEMSQLNG